MKTAEKSNFLERYLAQKALSEEIAPLSSMDPTGVYNAMGSLVRGGLSKDVRTERYKQYDQNIKNRSTPGHIAVSALKGGLTGAVPGALLGLLAAGGGQASGVGSFTTPQDYLTAAAIGAAGGGILGAGVGGGIGAASKFVDDRSSDEAKQHALAFKAQHPLLSAMPGGDVLGALFNQSKSAEQIEESLIKRASELLTNR